MDVGHLGRKTSNSSRSLDNSVELMGAYFIALLLSTHQRFSGSLSEEPLRGSQECKYPQPVNVTRPRKGAFGFKN